MLINCNSCKKKFTVPDSAITKTGRLLQCGFCGNKWTQYPVKEKAIKEIRKKTPIQKKVYPFLHKNKSATKKKRREVNLYSEEYLKKKHGLTKKDTSNSQDKRKQKNKRSFGFYSYILTISIFIITLFGVFNLSKDTVIANYPDVESYLNYFYEIIDICKIIILGLLN